MSTTKSEWLHLKILWNDLIHVDNERQCRKLEEREAFISALQPFISKGCSTKYHIWYLFRPKIYIDKAVTYVVPFSSVTVTKILYSLSLKYPSLKYSTHCQMNEYSNLRGRGKNTTFTHAHWVSEFTKKNRTHFFYEWLICRFACIHAALY